MIQARKSKHTQPNTYVNVTLCSTSTLITQSMLRYVLLVH